MPETLIPVFGLRLNENSVPGADSLGNKFVGD